MSDILKERNVKFATVLVTITIFITRFAVLKGLILNGFLLLLCAFLLCLRFKQVPPLTEEIRGYLKAFLVFFVSIVPSILFSDRPFFSGLNFLFDFTQYGVFLLIILFIRHKKYLVWLITFFFYIH